MKQLMIADCRLTIGERRAGGVSSDPSIDNLQSEICNPFIDRWENVGEETIG
jgi:hypothetical protein